MEKFTSGDDALKRSPTQHDSFDESDDDDGFYVVGYDQGEKVDERNISDTPPLPPDMQSTSFEPICPLTPSNITPKLASMSTLRPKSIQSHDRNVTPHTASLMSLFARPPITPLTPTTPNNFVGDDATSHDDNVNCTLKVFTGKIPNMPSMASQTPREVFSKHSQDIQQQQQVQQKDDEDTSLIAQTTSEELSSLTNLYTGPPSYFRQNTPVTQNCARHNRDETLMAHNLTTDENKSCIDDARILSSHDKFDCIRDNDENDEKTPMIDQPSNPVKSSMGLGGSAKKSDALLQSFQHKDESKNRLMNLPSNDYSTFSVTPDNNENSSPTYFVPIGEKDGLKTSKTANATCGIKINETKDEKNIMFRLKIHLRAMLSDFLHPQEIKTTLIGAFLFALYQLVFCFAQASAITRPSHPISSSNALLAPMACMACVGSLLTAPMLITVLSSDYPALYPCLDMFMAPFLAKMAADIDEVLVELRDSEASGEDADDTDVFLATFVALNAFGMLLSGVLCVLASKVKLANLASFLPYPVLCGFFSSVGISVWMSAFKVDTGVTIQRVLASGDKVLLLSSFSRHLPSLVVGFLLYKMGPMSPFFLIAIIGATVAVAYSIMALTRTSLEDAQDIGLFWKEEEVMMAPVNDGFHRPWGPPAAFGLWSPSVLRKICWPAMLNGMSDVIAMSLIYLIRCSLHAAALKKNLANVKANCKVNSEESSQVPKTDTQVNNNAVRLEAGIVTPGSKRKPRDVLEVLMSYSNGLFAIAFSGGFPVLPALALGGIFSKLGAHSRSPQYTAVALLFLCYLSDFKIVSYVPKCTFSSLLVLAAIDLVHSWFIKSFNKSAHVYEWFVVPFIVVASLTTGMLQSVGLGIAMSTLIFVESFHKAGVVKFLANGLTVRSTIERNCEDNEWLNQNADLIQILVLQNYMFFGNATSCLKYISTMFDDEDISGFDGDLPPIPKYIIIDMSIVTGIDTSAVDVLAEISSLCKGHNCQLILAGLPKVVRPALIAGGVKPTRLNSHLSFVSDLEAALGKAEDELLKFVGHNEEKTIRVAEELKHKRKISMADFGLRHALNSIDEQHNIALAKHLKELEKYTFPRDLEAGDQLNDDGSESTLPRGLYFIESGLLKCEHDSSASLTRGRRQSLFATAHMKGSTDSIGQLRARSKTVGRGLAVLKNTPGLTMAQNNTFRLARIGPGWVIGSISEFTGQDIPGSYTCMTACRVHHLSFETIEELEDTNPALTLHLYKLLAHLMARRQEMTIGQLATLRSIMNATAPTKPISRRNMAAVNKAMKSF